MNRKFKTKDQKKIERLEEILAEQKDEITNLKKDRKRLNYAVDRLEREKKRLTVNLNINAPNSANVTVENKVESNISSIQSEEVTAETDNSVSEIPSYSFNVSWIVEKVPEEISNGLEHFLEVSALEKLEESDFKLNDSETERTISYWIYPNGSEELIKTAKRITNAFIQTLLDPTGKYHFSLYEQRLK